MIYYWFYYYFYTYYYLCYYKNKKNYFILFQIQNMINNLNLEQNNLNCSI